jgi:hypothetical protein
VKARRLLVLVLGGIAVAGGLEIGARIYDRMRGNPWDAESSRAATRRLCDALALESSALPEAGEHEPLARETKMLQPYVGWELPSTQMRIAGDVEYYRGAGRETFDVCVLGGSAANALADALAQDPGLRGRSVRVHDYACDGYKQPQTSKLLGWLLALGHRPDAVVEIDGAGEAALDRDNARAGTHPGYPSIAAWNDAAGGMRSDWEMVDRLHDTREARDRTRAFGEWFLDSGLWRSCFLDHLGSMRLRTLDAARLAARRRLEDYVRDRPESEELRGPAFGHGEAEIDDAIVSTWERATQSISAMCAARDIPFLLVLAPAGADEDRVAPRLRAAAGKLSGPGARFLDLSAMEDARVAPAIAAALLADANR